ncbi:MAG TPA: hypothetical protein VHR66_28450 [Gemmataceae bacterium]|jgi:pyruvate dehydrogenase complex dehydrogenase (E1) component|nr:hypothetical protein [Gemmataceae bacterium]
MQRHFVTIVLTIFVAIPAWSAPRLPEEKGKVRSLIGTKWVGNSYEKREIVIEFLADGAVHVTYNDSPIENAGWRQDGDKIWFQLNKNYCEFDGVLKGDKLVGQCHNIANTQWDVTLTPVGKDR